MGVVHGVGSLSTDSTSPGDWGVRLCHRNPDPSSPLDSDRLRQEPRLGPLGPQTRPSSQPPGMSVPDSSYDLLSRFLPPRTSLFTTWDSSPSPRRSPPGFLLTSAPLSLDLSLSPPPPHPDPRHPTYRYRDVVRTQPGIGGYRTTTPTPETLL